MENTQPLIRIENLSFGYRKKPLLHIESLEIPSNQIITLLGPSGSGKTTLLNLIAGFQKPTHGKITVKGDKKTNNIGFILQDSSLYENISVFKNVYLSAINSKPWIIKNKLEAVLEFCKTHQNDRITNYLVNIQQIIDKIDSGLFNNSIWRQYKKNLQLISRRYFFQNLPIWLAFKKFCKIRRLFENRLHEIAKKLKIDELLQRKGSELSGGQRQRVAFAKAIIKNSTLILMDEPFASLDVKIKESTRDWLATIQKELKLSIIFVTHDQSDALRISDRILLINDGKVVQFDTPENLYNNPFNEFVAKFIGTPEIILIKEDNLSRSYIRNNKIQIGYHQQAEDIIIDKKLLGDLFVYEIFVQHLQRKIVINNTSNLYKITDKVKITYNDTDLIHFDKEGRKILNCN